MRSSFFLLTSALCGALLLAACSSSSTTTSTSPTEAPDGGESAKGAADAGDPDDPENQPPHSLGTITLGELHVAGKGGTATPIVSAVFVPDALKARSCMRKLDAACEILDAPKCKKSTSATGCATNEYCTFDDQCAPVCKPAAVCSLACEEDEICAIGTSGKAECVKNESFDAGPLAFSGTTSSITLYPPYTWDGDTNGAPFLAGADIKVQAQGALEAGFEKFEESFKATTFIQTNPPLNKLTREKVFGTGAVPVSWAKGADAILITVGGIGGTVKCKANDADGKFEIPRAVVNAARGEDVKDSSGTVSISVARQRTETKKGHTAKGKLSTATVQTEGWLDLVTVSTETAGFTGCYAGESICGDTCEDLQRDPSNCGTCGKACATGNVCSAGKCVDPAAVCRTCTTTADAGTCSTQLATCKANVSCNSLLGCIAACTTTTCRSTCQTTYAAGASLYAVYGNCVYNACYDECQ